MKHRTVITLEIVFDDWKYTDPVFWEWESLLSMEDDDKLEVTIRSHETTVEQSNQHIRRTR